jgi:hypothetical protein
MENNRMGKGYGGETTDGFYVDIYIAPEVGPRMEGYWIHGKERKTKDQSLGELRGEGRID